MIINRYTSTCSVLLALSFLAPPAHGQSAAEQELQQQQNQNMANQGMQIGGNASAREEFSGSYVDQLAPDTDGLNQLEYEENNSDTKNDGGSQAMGMGSMLTAIGAGLMATGAAMNASSKCHCAGMPLIAMAVGTIFPNASGAFSTGGAMYDRADLSDYYGSNLENLALNDNNVSGFDDNTNAGNGIFADNGPSGAGAGGLTSSGGSLGANIGAGFDDGTANGFKVGDAIQADSEALRTGRLGEAFDTLEELKGIDRDAFAAELLKGGNLGETMAKFGLADSADAFNSALSPYLSKEDAAATLAKFKNGELDEYGAIGGEEYADGSGKFANAAGGGADGEGSGESSTQIFGDDVDKLLGGANDMSLEELLGLNGKGKKEGADGKQAGDGDGPQRNLASANLAFAGGIESPGGVYTEASIFERVKRVYKAEMRELLPFDYFVRTKAKEKRRN